MLQILTSHLLPQLFIDPSPSLQVQDCRVSKVMHGVDELWEAAVLREGALEEQPDGFVHWRWLTNDPERAIEDDQRCRDPVPP